MCCNNKGKKGTIKPCHWTQTRLFEIAMASSQQPSCFVFILGLFITALIGHGHC